MEHHSNPHRPLADCLIAIRVNLGSCLTQVELLTVAAPFCAPLLELVRDELRDALSAAVDAEALERELTRMLAGPAWPDRNRADI